ncbi:MAG: TonB-dependent receptor [Betaproteobacteria bacterium]|nr:TonB-dependent receptor [Betaproteobacteria bacterium]
MAVELGATWSPDARTTAFASATRHFRNPNLDELLLATTDLHSQHGTTFEAGIRSRPGERVELSATAFLMRVVDEISFGSNAFGAISLNRNLAEPTRRFGGEGGTSLERHEPVGGPGQRGLRRAEARPDGNRHSSGSTDHGAPGSGVVPVSTVAGNAHEPPPARATMATISPIRSFPGCRRTRSSMQRCDSTTGRSR